jgi:RNA polymerase sigma factor (sigma-70 family)
MKAEKQKTSFDSFFRKEYKKLLNYVRKNIEERYFTVPPEDIIQDVALNLLNKLDVDLQVDNFAAYIYRSLKNRIIDEQRNTKNKMRIEYYEQDKKINAEVISISDESGSENNKIEDIDNEQLYDAISQLNAEEQEIILSTEFDGKTFGELSEEWNVPIGTLLSKKHRALGKLFKILTKNENKQLKIFNNGNERKLYGKRLLQSS